MKIGIVGYGVIGHVHAEVIKELGQKVTAVCDIDGEKLKTVDFAKTYSDFDEMIKNEDLDVVHICTPHYLHKEMIVKALGKGINVLSEKPMCIKKEDIDEIIEAEKNSSAIFGVSFQNRYNPAVQKAKEFLSGKKILGSYATMFWKRDKEYYSSGAWRGKIATEGGGVLINQFIHTIDLLCYLTGTPKKLIANVMNNTLKGVIEVEDTAFIKCFDGSDFCVFATNGSTQDFPVNIVIKTDGGTVTIIQNDLYINGEKVEVSGNAGFYGKSVYGSGHFALIGDFYGCIKEGRKFPIGAKEAATAVKIVLKAYESRGEIVDIG